MKIIAPSVEFFGAVPTDYENALKFIEKCGRVCYKSEDKITEGSAEKFVKRLIKSGHLAMVEHSNFVVRTNTWLSKDPTLTAGKYLNTLYTKDYAYVGGSLTAWYQRGVELDWGSIIFSPFIMDKRWLFFDTGNCFIDPKHTWEVCPHDEIPHELHRYSAKFICDRGVSHELVRHRPCSFAQESTRYVNYAGKKMEFIEPVGFEEWNNFQAGSFCFMCQTAEEHYNFQLSTGLKPQQARAVLPNALKTEIVVTADAREWAHIRKLRTAKDAHPDIQRVMNMMPWNEIC